MNIAIHGKVFSKDTIPVIERILGELHKHGARVFLSRSFYDIARDCGVKTGRVEVYTGHNELVDCSVLLSMGGDGTLLESVTHIGSLEMPILGINTGRLGFLATTTRDQVNGAVSSIINRDYEIENRTLVRVDTETDIFESLNFGLNEFAVLKQDTSSMITVHAWLDGNFLNSYWADGLIIATPTGSTGYSLSCGGPVVVPQSNNFILTPVSPHNLNVRPLVVSDTSTFEFKVESRSKYFLVSLDSRSKIVRSALKLTIKKEKFVAKLIKFDGYSFVDTLRKKLNWGLDVRN
jgi:NAD+ kinase